MSGWLVTGAGGLLGRELCARLTACGHPVLPLTHADLDLTDEGAVRRAVRDFRPAVVVNCAAWTDVDGAESAEDRALRVNGHAVRALARACSTARARLLHLSTDYVFAGDRTTPYPEDAAPQPHTAYGRTKLAGERAVLDELPCTGTVVRTAWVYGAHGRSFVATMLERARAGRPARVVDDQHGQPTWSRDVAEALVMLGTRPAEQTAGVFHATAAGHTTWYDLARTVYRLAGADPGLVTPITTAGLGRPTPRPAWTVLGHDRWRALDVAPPRPWDRTLVRALAQDFGIGVPRVVRPPAAP